MHRIDYKQIKRRIKNISKINITNTQDEWKDCIFINENNMKASNYFEGDRRVIILNSIGQVEMAYLPGIIEEDVLLKMETLYENHITDFTHLTPITGTWNRYGQCLRESKQATEKETEILSEMTASCKVVVKNVLTSLAKEHASKLQKLDTDLKRYADYPTLGINILKESNYDITKKPYKPHQDPHDVGLVSMLYFGEFEGGELVLEISNTEFKIKRGDLVLLNTYKFKHYVKKVTAGVRVGLVFFCGVDHLPISSISEDGEIKCLPPLECGKKNEKL